MRRQRGFTLIAYGLLALAVLASLGAISRAIFVAGENSKQAEWDEAVKIQQKDEMEKANAASLGLEIGNANAKIVYRTITKQVDKYIDRPVYRNTCFDDDGLRDVNAALIGATTPAGKPDKRLPKPDTTR